MGLSQLIKVAALLASACLTNASLQIVPGATWTSPNTHAHIQAHGAGVIEVDGTYYLIGEDKTNGSNFQHVNCYSSTDLVQWDYVGPLLSLQSSGDLGPNRVVERPKVIYNSKTKKYVLYMHIDSSSYGEAKVGVATGDSVCETYQYHGSWQPLGYQSRDIGLFQDDDGSAYLLTEDRANGLRIDSLTDDYLNVSASVYLFSDMEAPAMLKLNGYYFMFASHLTGWSANDNQYSYATSLSGPWSSWRTFATSGSNTYQSQTNYILPFPGNRTVMYMGDRWIASDLVASTYVWLPLTISGTTVSMQDYTSWAPNVRADSWSTAPSANNYYGVNAALSNGAVVVSCSGCYNNKAAGYIGGPSQGTATFSGITSSLSTLSTVQIVYRNGDSTARYANVTVNGVTQLIEFLPASSPGRSVINANLKAGSNNEIVIKTSDGTYGPDIGTLIVPQQ
ncbi:glycosyl hydrolase family 43 protein [Talaromyces stipitatus ATCC 10500]|uniref:Glycosyl hydrolase family 43 protein n=1 Tax=Talaromyces stipitatus (strain ATCC 10500 / CBS 375.48 / QM 6759 / NRRL 1006) TaxID=441959 RepID=B8MFR7_TALSN|nr:glycosyl hydrolase family 43 protein [Talaromyces stipitatus ATCC 10500]EED17057.1 glycosyl hydrolase family 43 protein [Talaromyces stipitatus ATCC 10500]